MLSKDGKERHVQFSVYEMSIHHDQSCGWRILWKTFDEIIGKDDTELFSPEEAQIIMEKNIEVMN